LWCYRYSSETLGATLIPAKWTGHPNIQLINHGEETIDLREGDELVNVEYLQVFVG
jgi:deoxycytidine triphosphate deaminase